MANNSGITSKLLDWAYNKALSGFGGVDSAYALAHNYIDTPGSIDDKVNRLIKWQVTKSATSGFVTGLGGLTVLPFAISANIASVIYIQIRMIAAIAYIGGHDIESDRVKSMIYLCMAGNGAKELAKDATVKAGEKVINHIVKNASSKLAESLGGKTLSIASRFGAKGLSNMGKVIPVMGGIVGASFDAAATKLTGNIAKKTFIDPHDQLIIITDTKDKAPISL